MKEVRKISTEKGMGSFSSSGRATVDLFYKIGASRGKDISGLFLESLRASKELTGRIALWARDIRGGMGERQLFRDILLILEKEDKDLLKRIIRKVPLVGRWDDLFIFNDEEIKAVVWEMVRWALVEERNGLCAKWVPRKGEFSEGLRKYMRLTHKSFRKLLVSLTEVVETKMCERKWEEIEFGKVPSRASAIYSGAFKRHTPLLYNEYLKAVAEGREKINASALYPYEVLKWCGEKDEALVNAMWEALPNYLEDGVSILPMVDVSGSMMTNVGRGVEALLVAVSLGLYLSSKNSGPFKDHFLTFSGEPSLVALRGSLVEKKEMIEGSEWGMNTDLNKAFRLILELAKKGGAPQSLMPKMLLILSDMQFDEAVEGETALGMIKREYETYGYELPKVVFWNLNAKEDVPVSFRESGVALVSGFSPSIMKVLLNSAADFTPEGVMIKTVMNERYSF